MEIYFSHDQLDHDPVTDPSGLIALIGQSVKAETRYGTLRRNGPREQKKPAASEDAAG